MEKLNIAELLKDCPSGMELDCLLWDNVTFERVADNGIWIKHIDSKSNEHSLYVYNDGSFPIHNLDSLRTKCVIFPKGKTTWEGFHRPFKDGDIVCNIENAIIIYKKISTKGYCGSFASLDRNNIFIPHYLAYIEDTCRFATKEEKQKLFDAIKTSGYKWNSEPKSLEELIKPKFKVGDRVKLNNSTFIYTITDLMKDRYRATVDSRDLYEIEFERQDAYKLVSNKFDITTLKPFESKVLVKDMDYQAWEGAIFGRYDGKKFFTIGGLDWEYCIPYKGNEHLLGTTGDCDDYYKIWK